MYQLSLAGMWDQLQFFPPLHKFTQLTKSSQLNRVKRRHSKVQFSYDIISLMFRKLDQLGVISFASILKAQQGKETDPKTGQNRLALLKQTQIYRSQQRPLISGVADFQEEELKYYKQKFPANKIDSICLIFSVFIKPPGRKYCPLKRTIAPLSKFARTSSFKLPTKAWIQTTYCFTYSKSLPTSLLIGKSQLKQRSQMVEESGYSIAVKPPVVCEEQGESYVEQQKQLVRSQIKDQACPTYYHAAATLTPPLKVEELVTTSSNASSIIDYKQQKNQSSKLQKLTIKSQQNMQEDQKSQSDYKTILKEHIQDKLVLTSSQFRDKFSQYFFVSGLKQIHTLDLPQIKLFFNAHLYEGYEAQFPLEPTVLQRFPIQDYTDFAFPQQKQISAICFPLGVRILLPLSNKNKKAQQEVLPKEQCNYLSTTNQDGKRYFISSMIFYQKYTLQQFSQQMKCKIQLTQDQGNNMLQNQSAFHNDAPTFLLYHPKLSSSLYSKMQKKTMNSKKQQQQDDDDNNENIHKMIQIIVPKAVSLISRFPYYKQMQGFLRKAIQFALHSQYQSILPRLLSLVVFEIPKPFFNCNLFLPYDPSSNAIMKIRGSDKDSFPYSPFNLQILFRYLTHSEVFYILACILQEKKVIVIFNDISYISMFISAIVHAIYPLKWVHTIIPILPLGLCDIVQSPWPYLLGIYDQMFEVLNSDGMYDFSESLIVDLGKSRLFVPTYVSQKVGGSITKRKKSVLSKKKMIQFKGKLNKQKDEKIKFTESVYPLPKSVIKIIIDGLKSEKCLSSSASLSSSSGSSKKTKIKSPSTSNNSSIKFRKVFLRAMAELLRKTDRHTVFLIDNTPIFNKQQALKNRKLNQDDKKSEYYYFYDTFYDTQSFNYFLQEQMMEEMQEYLRPYIKISETIQRRRVSSVYSQEQVASNNESLEQSNSEPQQFEEDKIKRQSSKNYDQKDTYKSGSSGRADLQTYSQTSSSSRSTKLFQNSSFKDQDSNFNNYLIPTTLLHASVSTKEAFYKSLAPGIFSSTSSIGKSDDTILHLKTDEYQHQVNPECKKIKQFILSGKKSQQFQPKTVYKFEDQLYLSNQSNYQKPSARIQSLKRNVNYDPANLEKYQQKRKSMMLIRMSMKMNKGALDQKNQLQQNNDQISEQFKEEIEQSIEVYMRILFLSKCLTVQQLQNLTWILSYQYGREYCIKALQQPKFQSGQSHCFAYETYDQIAMIMYIAILEADRQADYPTAHAMLQLSQLFYRQNFENIKSGSGNQRRVYLISQIGNHLIWTKREFWLEAVKLRGYGSQTTDQIEGFNLISSIVNEMILLRIDSWKVENIAFQIANFMKMSLQNKEILGLLVGKLINARRRQEFDQLQNNLDLL